MCLDGKRNDQMAFHALADYQNHVIGWLQWEQSSLGDGAVVRFPRIWMSSGECRLSSSAGTPSANARLTCHDERERSTPDSLLALPKAKVALAIGAGLEGAVHSHVR